MRVLSCQVKCTKPWFVFFKKKSDNPFSKSGIPTGAQSSLGPTPPCGLRRCRRRPSVSQRPLLVWEGTALTVAQPGSLGALGFGGSQVLSAVGPTRGQWPRMLFKGFVLNQTFAFAKLKWSRWCAEAVHRGSGISLWSLDLLGG